MVAVSYSINTSVTSWQSRQISNDQDSLNLIRNLIDTRLYELSTGKTAAKPLIPCVDVTNQSGIDGSCVTKKYCKGAKYCAEGGNSPDETFGLCPNAATYKECYQTRQKNKYGIIM